MKFEDVWISRVWIASFQKSRKLLPQNSIFHSNFRNFCELAIQTLFIQTSSNFAYLLILKCSFQWLGLFLNFISLTLGPISPFLNFEVANGLNPLIFHIVQTHFPSLPSHFSLRLFFGFFSILAHPLPYHPAPSISDWHSFTVFTKSVLLSWFSPPLLGCNCKAMRRGFKSLVVFVSSSCSLSGVDKWNSGSLILREKRIENWLLILEKKSSTLRTGGGCG